VLIAEGLTKER